MSLTDIDSLCQNVRDSDSRKLIEEAVSTFRCGAFRSAVITTWVTICYDILSKARELTNQGEILPEFMAKHDKACKDKNIRTLLDIEKTLLAKAKEWGLIGDHEFALLQRLREDRHMCAHPAFESDGTWFQPTPEQVRTHIVHALTILLVQTPLLGKNVIENFERRLLSNTFPTKTEEIQTYMKAYLQQLKNNAVKTLISFLLTTLFTDEANKFKRKEYMFLMVLREMINFKRKLYEEVGPVSIKRTLQSVQHDQVVLRICTFLEVLPDLWNDVGDMVKTSVKTGLTTATVETLIKYDAFGACNVEEIEVVLTQRKKDLTENDKEKLFQSHPPRRALVDLIITDYGNSGCFATAKERGATVDKYAHMFTENDVTLLLQVVEDNNKPSNTNQILSANGTSDNLESVLNRLPEDKRKATCGAWRGFCEKHKYHWGP